ncbi:FAD/NAD(P)-binding domain-containing protein [Suillus decipiens]|nr:FAD/NAD(P)-binding domain-containing protein [Suillus decipiens]
MPSQMTNTRVIIVGAGIAGPVLAIFLKMKGYDPIIYERLPGLGEGGLGVTLQPNGMRVLSLIPDFLEKIPGHSPDRLIHCSCLDGVEDILVDDDSSPATMREQFGFPIMGVRRPEFRQLLVDTAEKHGVEIKWGCQAIEFEQSDDAVEVTFANGTKDMGSFVVGCDGLHSDTRIALFGNEKAEFTGMVRIGGVSPTPPIYQGSPANVNNYGDGRHMIAYPITKDKYSWAITTRGAEAKEDWRTQNAEQQNEIRNGPLSAWGFGAGDLVRTGQNIVKYGLYDRPELKSWFKGRIVLLGDAAHLSTPHLGQGANQALEDIYHLMRLLGKYNPSAEQPSTEILLRVFTDYQDLRLLRTSELVKKARRQGEIRVVEGLDACRARDETIRIEFNDDAARRARDELLSGPFTESEM